MCIGAGVGGGGQVVCVCACVRERLRHFTTSFPYLITPPKPRDMYMLSKSEKGATPDRFAAPIRKSAIASSVETTELLPPLDDMKHAPRFEEYVIMEPGTPLTVALANLRRRIDELQESCKENERITQKVSLYMCLLYRCAWQVCKVLLMAVP